jgi:hypothetical protein
MLRVVSPTEFELPQTLSRALFGVYGVFLALFLMCESRVLFAEAR